ncbi:hypothetical protein EAT1b_0232 [Exiguobacterium sp. AT1b]|uniref:Uncharacterized protein n=1 Tax=Exiguobacterium sp. (strain ATCC BAA-1283 / AT1b) TaxID=360911 RepID=C4L1Z1_EXISA|nr:hypothetical protein EAT1b_0232 [Exiguobacterium sp. AT1b]
MNTLLLIGLIPAVVMTIVLGLFLRYLYLNRE